MKWLFLSLGVLLFTATKSYAVPITLFVNTELFVERSRDIVVAKCLAVHNEGPLDDGIYAADVEIVNALKGDKKPGKARIATIYPMEKGRTYLLASLGGSALGTDLLAIPQRSVVEIPAGFDLKSLKGKTVLARVRAIFDAEEKERARQLREVEKKLLEKAHGK